MFVLFANRSMSGHTNALTTDALSSAGLRENTVHDQARRALCRCIKSVPAERAVMTF